MKDDGETVGENGEEGPLADRQAQNHGSRENELSGLDNFPSAPPGVIP